MRLFPKEKILTNKINIKNNNDSAQRLGEMRSRKKNLYFRKWTSDVKTNSRARTKKKEGKKYIKIKTKKPGVEQKNKTQ